MPTFEFTGEYEHQVDDRGRLAIPSAFRQFFVDGGYLLPGPDGQLELFTTEGFQAVTKQRTVSGRRDKAARRLARVVFGGAFKVQLDRGGRILIPQRFREQRGLSGRTSIVGVGKHLEIWNADQWEQELAESEATYAEILEDEFETNESMDSPEEPS